MDDGSLFRLGIDLETGATHEEARESGHEAVITRDVFDETRDDHFIRRDGKVFAGTHLIIEVVDADGLDDEDRIQNAFRACVDQCGATLLHMRARNSSLPTWRGPHGQRAGRPPGQSWPVSAKVFPQHVAIQCR